MTSKSTNQCMKILKLDLDVFLIEIGDTVPTLEMVEAAFYKGVIAGKNLMKVIDGEK